MYDQIFIGSYRIRKNSERSEGVLEKTDESSAQLREDGHNPEEAEKIQEKPRER